MSRQLIMALVLSIGLSGCLPTAVTKSNKPEAGEGEFTKGDVVRAFPNLPRFPETQVVESVNAGGSYGASFVSSKNLDKVVEFYIDTLPQLGWESQLVKKTEANFEFRVKNSQYEGIIIINTAADGVKTAITYSLSPR